MLVGDMMTRAVSSAAPNSSAQSVAQLMRTDGSDAVVLVNDGIPVALITDRDLALAVVAEDAGADRDALAYASSPVIAVGEDADVADAARLMSRHGISRVVVLDGGRLAGVVSAGDVAAPRGRSRARRAAFLRTTPRAPTDAREGCREGS